MLEIYFSRSKNLLLRIISRKDSDLSENPQRLCVKQLSIKKLSNTRKWVIEDIVQAWWRHQEFMFIAKHKSNTESKVAKSFVG